MARQSLQGLGRHVFKFSGETGGDFCQSLQARCVCVARLNMVVAYAPSRAGGVGIEHRREVAHLLSRVRQHTPELPAPQHA